MVGSAEPLRIMGCSPPDTCGAADCHPVEDMRFHLLKLGRWDSPEGTNGWNCIDYALWGSSSSGATHRVKVTAFLYSVGNLACLLFKGIVEALLLFSTVGSAGLCILWEAGLLVPTEYQNTSQWRSCLDNRDGTILQADTVGSAWHLYTLGKQVF
jgi:hypothetical protein